MTPVLAPVVGDVLPEFVVESTVRNIVSTAIATRDFQDVHHDVASAQQRGSKTIFTNILTSNGYALRLVTDWAGPLSVVKSAKIRLGVPNYAGDVLTVRGEVTAVEGKTVTVAVRGSNSLGDHITGSVVVELSPHETSRSAHASAGTPRP